MNAYNQGIHWSVKKVTKLVGAVLTAGILACLSKASAQSLPDAITGLGFLQLVGNAATHNTSSNPNNVWFTNVTALVESGMTSVTFTIQGGQAGYLYDIFSAPALKSPFTNAVWTWLGQCPAYGIYSFSITNSNAFMVMGTPQDSSGADLTDAYQLLVLHSNPNVTDADFDAIPTGWDIALGLNLQTSNLTQASLRTTYGYTKSDRLNGLTGVRNGTVSNDGQGNVLQVSQ